MSRFIFRFNGEGQLPAEDVRHVESQPSVRVVDTTPRMLLVESSPEQAEALARALPRWAFSPERGGVPLPRSPRPQLRGPAVE